ncbi:hypothetical protein BV22DRAFT_445564 [Leucogyrophana mollusca]|uniref:Uncharacterized protein n=1 Tax=Leucogyrophana mollusca TaxID=85980 RepID=A0ACB8BHH6_9AGAM|nr:hypothetical protein BV22DRAFT_445564 [Leucogyrophana mollusca]
MVLRSRTNFKRLARWTRSAIQSTERVGLMHHDWSDDHEHTVAWTRLALVGAGWRYISTMMPRDGSRTRSGPLDRDGPLHQTKLEKYDKRKQGG